jgi:hypothetical protein
MTQSKIGGSPTIKWILGDTFVSCCRYFRIVARKAA